MKKIFFAGLSTILFACNADTKTETTSTEDTTVNGTATTVNETNLSNDTVTVRAYVPADGDVVYRNGKVMVWRNGTYVESTKDVKLDDGTVVKRNGEVIRNEKTVKLEEGEAVNRSGKFFDKAGEAMEDAWEGTKKGVRKAGEALKKAGEKVGEEVKDAVN